MAMKRVMMALGCAALVTLAAQAGTNNVDIVAAARQQIGVTVGDDPAYRTLGYPGGDVPRSSGVCTVVGCPYGKAYGGRLCEVRVF